MLTVKRESKVSLTQQVYEQIRNSILEKKFMEGEKLPSTRELASSLEVSRNVCLEAFDRLITEGYLEVRPRSGTYVAKGITFQREKEKPHPVFPAVVSNISKDVIDFRAANPAMDHFPRKIWGRLTKEVCNDTPEVAFAYSGSEGVKKLREVLSQ